MITNGLRRVGPAALFTLYASGASALPVLSTWTGGTTGAWEDAANWSSAAFPDNGTDTFDVEIDGGAAQNTTVTLSSHRLIDSLVVDAGDTLVLTDSTMLELIDDASGAGTIETQGTAAFYTFGNLTGLTHTGTGTIDVTYGTVGGGFTQSEGFMFVRDATTSGLLTNDAVLTFLGNGSYEDTVLAGTGSIGGDGTLTAVTAADTFTISGDQTVYSSGPVGPHIAGGRVDIDGALRVADGSAIHFDNSVVGGTGILDTQGSGSAFVIGELTGLTHIGSGSVGLAAGVVGGGFWNADGFLTAQDSMTTGLLTNDAVLTFLGNGSYEDTVLAGTGSLGGDATLTAVTPTATFTITGDQTVLSAAPSGPRINGGRVVIDGALRVTDGSAVYLENAVVGGTGILDTQGDGRASLIGELTGLTHIGSGSVELVAGSVGGGFWNSDGFLTVQDSMTTGLLTNDAILTFIGIGSYEDTVLAGTGVLGGEGTLNAVSATDTFTISGDQTVIGIGPLGPRINGGLVAIDGALRVADGAGVNFENSVVGGTGFLDTQGSGAAYLIGDLSGITHIGTGTISHVGGNVGGGLTNASGALVLSASSVISGQLTNQALLATTAPVLNVDAGGILSLDDGEVVGDTAVLAGGELNGHGAIHGDLAIDAGGVFGFDASVTPLDIYGNFTTEGLLQFELGGLLGSEHDLINVFAGTDGGGEANIGGLIQVMAVDGYLPLAGDFFDLITADSIVDSGFAFEFADMSAGLGLDLVGSIVDLGPRTVLRLTIQEGQSSTSVPEPGTAGLLAAGALILLWRRKRAGAGRSRAR